MTLSVLRNSLLLIVALAVAAVVCLPSRLVPRIKCTPNVKEGEPFYCSVNLGRPPLHPEFTWSKESGDCQADSLSGQTIRLTTPPQADGQDCKLSAIVRDAATDLIAEPVKISVPITRISQLRLECAPGVHEGETFSCYAKPDSPLKAAEFTWTKTGGSCESNNWKKQSIELMAPSAAPAEPCKLHAVMRELPSLEIRGAGDVSVPIEKSGGSRPVQSSRPGSGPGTERGAWLLEFESSRRGEAPP